MRPQLLVLVVLLLAAAFRFLIMGDIRFTGDEAYFWSTARDIVELKRFPAYGSPITGSEAHVPSPLFHYLMALPQVLGRSPRWGAGFVVVLHLVGAWLVFDLARRVRGERAGIFAIALLAFAPWDIFYGSSMWLSSVVPVHGTLLLYAAFRVGDGVRWQTVFALMVGISTALHSSTPVAAAAGLLLVLVAPPERWSWRHVLLGFGLAFLAYTPSIVQELQTGFANTRAVLAKAGGAEPVSYLVWVPLKVLGYLTLFSSSEISYHLARGYWGAGFSELDRYFTTPGLKTWMRELGLLAVPVLLSVLLSSAGMLRTVKQAIHGVRGWFAKASRPLLSAEHRLSMVLVATPIIATVLLLLMKKLFFPHYVNPLLQVFVLPAAFLLDALAARSVALARVAAAWTIMVATSMAAVTWIYVHRVDQLNGLDATIAIAARLAEETEPVALYFDHFHNGYSVRMVLERYYRRHLEFGAHGRVVYRVHNSAPHTGPLPPDSWLVGQLRISRTERKSR